MKDREIYQQWIAKRNNQENDYCEKPCYCGHKKVCVCQNPDYKLFKELVNNKTIKL